MTVFAFLSGEKHKIGFLGNQGVIGSEAVRKVPDEALEQLEQEEAELDAWMQSTQRQASAGSTGKSRPSSGESSGNPDSDRGEGSSRRRIRRSRKRKSHRSEGLHESSPDVEVPINEEMPECADEPPEKRSREEATVGEGMIFLLSLFIYFHGISPCFEFLLYFPFLAEDDDSVTPEVPVDEVTTDPAVAPEEEPRDSEMFPESPIGITSFDFFSFFLSMTKFC